jgi:hypothetical protein
MLLLSESIDCPYCQNPVAVPVVQDSVTSQYLRCRSCGGIFEYMPDFGAFSLPDKGAEYMRQQRTSAREALDESRMGMQPDARAQGGGGGCGACCCIFMLMGVFIWVFYVLGLI